MPSRGNQFDEIIKASLQYEEPDKLDFDPNNPRFGGAASGKSQPAIQKLIFGPPYYASELVDSLVENGFIDYEPLVVRKNGERFVVIEGNRRLAAVNEIRANPEKYPAKKSDLAKIPVLVFPSSETDQSQTGIRTYLGVRHLLGIREWPPIAKAMFLDRESRSSDGLDKVLKEVRLTKTQARRFLIPFRLLKKAGVPLPPGEDFWVLAEALNRSGVKDFLQLDVDGSTLHIAGFNKQNLSIVLDHLYGPRISSSTHYRDAKKRKVHDTRDLSVYSNVLASDKARSALASGRDLEEAALYLGTDEQSLVRLVKMLKALRLLISKVTPTSAAKRDSAAAELRSAFARFESAVKAFQKKNA
jgi:hypothetical protein